MTVDRARSNRWWSAHTHSRKSKDDALSPVTELVQTAAALDYPALGLTDHGDPGGSVELYTACKKAGIAPLPGIELYLTPDAAAAEKRSMHLTVLSRTAQGYRNLVALNNYAQRNYYRRPRVDFPALASFAEAGMLSGLVVGTGCRSGPVVRALTERGPAAAKQVVEALAGWFPQLYVELMDHGFTADGMWDHEICDALLDIADSTGLPYIITSDSHYARPEQVRHHDALKELVTFAEDPEDGHFKGSGYWLPDEAYLAGVFEPDVLAGAIASLSAIAENAAVQIPELDTFSLKVPDVTLTGDPMTELRLNTEYRLKEMGERKGWSKAKCERAAQRIADELEVVEVSGFAAYLNMVIGITDECWRRGIWFHTRGSATGSMILYVNGVTQEDPLDWDIRFDRFLSPDRTSPPDVDLDLEHTRRDEIVDWLRELYPVLQVGTTMTYSLGGDEEGKGSLRVKYFSTANKGKTDEDKIRRWEDVPVEDKAMLAELSELELVSGRGAHPGGYIIAADESVVASLPLVQIGSSNTFVTAYDKGEVEKMGFPKIDLLGSKVLTALRICCTLVTEAAGDGQDPREWYAAIPRDDKEAVKRAGSGNTQGLFQLSGWTQRRGMEDMKPKNVKEIVAGQAIFRPAPIASGFTDSYLLRRAGKEQIPPMHDDIAAETKATYGLAIYQEQLVGVMRRLGMGSEQLTKMLKAVKASGKAGEEAAKKAVAEELDSIQHLARERGWEERDVSWLATTLTDYGAGYSFGKAHSVQYGVVAYLTCWLVTHEPLAFWTGMLLAYTGSKNSKKEDLELIYAMAARKDGVRVLPAHVNRSGAVYAADPDAFAIRKGLLSVSGVGPAAAAELEAKAPYADLVDLAKRVLPARVSGVRGLLDGVPPGECGGAVKALYEAGALEGIPAGTPVRRAKGRKRKCETCKTTFPSPLEYEIHEEEVHA